MEKHGFQSLICQIHQAWQIDFFKQLDRVTRFAVEKINPISFLKTNYPHKREHVIRNYGK